MLEYNQSYVRHGLNDKLSLVTGCQIPPKRTHEPQQTAPSAFEGQPSTYITACG